ncbi:MAG: twin-arginine translocase TatA/TatE family subunit [Chloroflexi bacterium]|nr:twin-arginine translocase TatA/TatE family subunit [Chloroflexota bacterium]
MEIFGIGPMELLLILIIALMVFGPDKLPEIGAKLGRSLREMRQATRQFSQEIEQTRQAIEAPIQEAREAGGELTKPFQEAQAAVATIGTALSHPSDLIRDSVMRNLKESVTGAAEADASSPRAAPSVEPASTAYAEVALEPPPALPASVTGEAAPPGESDVALAPSVPADQLPLPFAETDTQPAPAPAAGAEPVVETVPNDPASPAEPLAESAASEE